MSEPTQHPEHPGVRDPRPPAIDDPGSEIHFDEEVERHSKTSFLHGTSLFGMIAMGLAIVGFVVWLEFNSVDVDLPSPEVSKELLRNEGLTEGLPTAININQVAVFKIDGTPGRADEIVAALEGAITDLEDQPGREITLDESGDMPAVIQLLPDGSGRRELIRVTAGDLTLSGQTDAKFLSRVWGERLTDALKVFMFGEPPTFTTGVEFGEALTMMYNQALESRGAISLSALDNAYEELPESRQGALADFPVLEAEEAPQLPAGEQPLPEVSIR